MRKAREAPAEPVLNASRIRPAGTAVRRAFRMARRCRKQCGRRNTTVHDDAGSDAKARRGCSSAGAVRSPDTPDDCGGVRDLPHDRTLQRCWPDTMCRTEGIYGADTANECPQRCCPKCRHGEHRIRLPGRANAGLSAWPDAAVRQCCSNDRRFRPAGRANAPARGKPNRSLIRVTIVFEITERAGV